MKKERIAILVLGILVIVLLGYIIFAKGSLNTKFLEDDIKLQDSISYYLGQLSSDTFDAYTKEQIITGSVNEGKITSINGKEIIPIVDVNEKITINNENYYKINLEKLKEALNITISEYDGTAWYLSSDGIVKVKVSIKPGWWTNSFDSLRIS